MRPTTHALIRLAALLPVTVLADPDTEVRQAVKALAATNYSWETTVRQRFNGEITEPRLNPNAPAEVQGRITPDSYMEITVMPSREALPVPVSAVYRTGDVVAHTPLGWLRRSEMRAAAGPDRAVDFEGQPVRLSRALSVGLRATTLRPPTEELLDLIADFKSCNIDNGLVIAELREAAIEKLWGTSQAKRAPDVQGKVLLKLSDAGVAEYHIVLAIGFPNSRTKKTAWSIMQWSTRIKAIGSTTVDPPAAAVKRLAE